MTGHEFVRDGRNRKIDEQKKCECTKRTGFKTCRRYNTRVDEVEDICLVALSDPPQTLMLFQRLGGAGIRRFRPRGWHENNPFRE